MKKMFFASALAICGLASSSMLYAYSQEQRVIDSFYAELFKVAFQKGISDRLEITPAQEQCITQTSRDKLDILGSQIAMQKLSAKERKLLADFLNTPFGSDMYAELLKGNIHFKNLDTKNYDEKQYDKYEPIIAKAFNEEVIFDRNTEREMKKALMHVMLECDIISE